MLRTKLYYTIESRDRKGKLLRRFTRKSRSFVQQWNEIVYVQWAQASNVSIKDTGGTDRNVDRAQRNMDVVSAAGYDTVGLVCGTGDTAVTISDYKLEAQINEGTGSGQLEHQTPSFTAPTVSGSECSFTYRRVFINSSGATITVKEIGVYCNAQGDATVWQFMDVRDVLDPSIDVPDGGSLTVTYTVKVVV